MIGIVRLAEQSTAERDGRPDRLKGVGGQFLRHQPDHRAGRPVIPHDVVTVDCDLAFGQGHDPADDADQCGLAGTVRAQEGKDLTAANVQADILERAKARGVGLRQI